MGMFDRIFLKVRCPNCGDKSVKEFQTKEWECNLLSYEVGDKAPDENCHHRWIHGTVGCTSETCQLWQTKKDGYRSGFGYCWDLWIWVNGDGIITDEYRPSYRESLEDLIANEKNTGRLIKLYVRYRGEYHALPQEKMEDKGEGPARS